MPLPPLLNGASCPMFRMGAFLRKATMAAAVSGATPTATITSGVTVFTSNVAMEP